MQYKQAKEIAIRLFKKLEPVCKPDFVDIAGGIRREKAEPHDIEICCIPKITEVKNLFQEVTGTQRLNGFIQTVNSFGQVIKGDVNKGRMIQVALPEGITLDLFVPQETDYQRQYAIRTGSAEYSHKVLANAWLKKGWAGTDNGLRLQIESYQKVVGKDKDGKDKKKWFCDRKEPTLPPVFANELELFQWLNIPWIEPKNRYV